MTQNYADEGPFKRRLANPACGDTISLQWNCRRKETLKRTLPWIVSLISACSGDAINQPPQEIQPRVRRERKEPEKPAVVQDSTPASEQAEPVKAASSPSPAPAEKAVEVTIDENCQALNPPVTMPAIVDKPPMIAIGFLKTCTLPNGEQGFIKGSSWTAMGFPCTRGRGRIDRKGGSENAPSLINFLMPTSCPMEPATQEEAERVLRHRFKIPADSRLIAYYPLSIDYWEFPQLSERDTGFMPSLFSQAGLNLWQKYSVKSEPIRVLLFGRENAWEKAKSLYQVEADIVHESRSTFRLQIIRAKLLSDEDRKSVRDRCEDLRPKRDCGEIFD